MYPEKFDWWAVKLGIIIFIVYAITLIYPDTIQTYKLVSSQVLAKPWTIITHIFLHDPDTLTHIGSNVFALLLFGTILESKIGSRKFLVVFFSAGIVSSAGDILFYSSTIGASGAIFGILGCLAILRPKTIAWVLGVPMYIIVAAFVWAALDLMGMFYPDNIAHAAHLLGMGSGLIMGLELRRKFPEPKKPKEKEVVSEKELDEWEEEWMK